MLNQQALWTCPICKAKHQEPVHCCKRCGCNLNLLNRVKIKAFNLAMEGKVAESNSLLSFDELKALVAPLPPKWVLGPGFLMFESPLT